MIMDFLHLIPLIWNYMQRTRTETISRPLRLNRPSIKKRCVWEIFYRFQPRSSDDSLRQRPTGILLGNVPNLKNPGFSVAKIF